MAKKKEGLTNSPEVEHRLDAVGENDAQAEVRAAIKESVEEAKALAQAEADRALALAAPIQKVVDANEHAAMLSLTGQLPVRDMSDAPPPGRLGPHTDENPLTDSELKSIQENLGVDVKDAAREKE